MRGLEFINHHESPYSVGRGIYQFEGNLFLRNTSIEPTFSIPQSFGFDMLFRTSLLSEKLELNAHGFMDVFFGASL